MLRLAAPKVPLGETAFDVSQLGVGVKKKNIMKLNKIKFTIIAATLFLFTAALPFETQAQIIERVPFASQEEFLPALPLRSGENTCEPGNNGNANGEIEFPAPVSGGLWIVIGLAIAYGVFCRRSRKKDDLIVL